MNGVGEAVGIWLVWIEGVLGCRCHSFFAARGNGVQFICLIC